MGIEVFSYDEKSIFISTQKYGLFNYINSLATCYTNNVPK